MKKIVCISVFILVSSLSTISAQDCDSCEEQDDYRFTTALTAGFVFKPHDCAFKEVYGNGIVNILTADGCYYFWKPCGIGAKVSYWRAEGCTTFFKQCALLQEIPLTFYLRGLANFECGLQLYASLGGGVIWIKEKSYLAHLKFHKGIGEIEAGLNYPIYHCLNATGALRLLFPSQVLGNQNADIGGVDLRAGIAFVF